MHSYGWDHQACSIGQFGLLWPFSPISSLLEIWRMMRRIAMLRLERPLSLRIRSIPSSTLLTHAIICRSAAHQEMVTRGMLMVRFDGSEHSAGVIVGIYPGIGSGFFLYIRGDLLRSSRGQYTVSNEQVSCLLLVSRLECLKFRVVQVQPNWQIGHDQRSSTE